MKEITFTVPGKAVAKGRPKFSVRGGFARAYTPAPTVQYENLVKMAAAEAIAGQPGWPFEGAVEIGLVVNCAIPKSFSKKKHRDALSGVERPTTKPDLDNVAKAILDAINGVLLKDDSQVVNLCVEKHYSDTPCVQVNLGLREVIKVAEPQTL